MTLSEKSKKFDELQVKFVSLRDEYDCLYNLKHNTIPDTMTAEEFAVVEKFLTTRMNDLYAECEYLQSEMTKLNVRGAI